MAVSERSPGATAIAPGPGHHLPEPTKPTETGASLVEYVMLLAFVAVIGIIGVRAVGPAAAALFDVERLGLGTTSPPAEVLGVTVEREVTIGTAITLERPPAACQPAAGIGGVYPTCPS